jgi:hypothetical protein
VRPLVRRVIDQATGDETKVAIPCASTRETVCPSCADRPAGSASSSAPKAGTAPTNPTHRTSQDQVEDDTDDQDEQGDEGSRRIRSTRRRQDAADLPKVPAEDRAIGKAFVTPDVGSTAEHVPHLDASLLREGEGGRHPGRPGAVDSRERSGRPIERG